MAVDNGLSMVEMALDGLLAISRPAALSEAMRYAVMSGGKRIRPHLCLAASLAVGGRLEDAIQPACAIELLHSYTLIHDDLPAMDDDAMRRGMPSVWAKFGEATAILAGDALQALAFQTAARSPRNATKILAALGEAGVGVVRGQAEELATIGLEPSERDIDFVHRHKTADLFMAAAVMGAYAGGGSDAAAERLRAYALNLGLAFQLEDDLIDGELPYPKDEIRRRISDLTSEAISLLDELQGDTVLLVALAKRLAARRR